MFLIPVRGRGVWHLYYLSRATQTRGVFRAVTRFSAAVDDEDAYAVRRIDVMVHSLGICVIRKWARLIAKSLENADGYKASVNKRWEQVVDETEYTRLHPLDIMAEEMPIGTLLMFLIYTLMTPGQESVSYMLDAVDHLYRNSVDCITGVAYCRQAI